MSLNQHRRIMSGAKLRCEREAAEVFASRLATHPIPAGAIEHAIERTVEIGGEWHCACWSVWVVRANGVATIVTESVSTVQIPEQELDALIGDGTITDLSDF